MMGDMESRESDRPAGGNLEVSVPELVPLAGATAHAKLVPSAEYGDSLSLSCPSVRRLCDHPVVSAPRRERSQPAGGGFDPCLGPTRAGGAARQSGGLRHGGVCLEKPANPLVAARQFLLRAVRGLEPRGDRQRLRGAPRLPGEKLGRETHSWAADEHG